MFRDATRGMCMFEDVFERLLKKIHWIRIHRSNDWKKNEFDGSDFGPLSISIQLLFHPHIVSECARFLRFRFSFGLCVCVCVFCVWDILLLLELMLVASLFCCWTCFRAFLKCELRIVLYALFLSPILSFPRIQLITRVLPHFQSFSWVCALLCAPMPTQNTLCIVSKHSRRDR